MNEKPNNADRENGQIDCQVILNMLEVGKTYSSPTHCLVRYEGIDNYMGQISYKFYSITYGNYSYWLFETLNKHISK